MEGLKTEQSKANKTVTGLMKTLTFPEVLWYSFLMENKKKITTSNAEMMDQLSLDFNEAEAYAYGTKSATAEQVAVKAHARKQQSGSVTDIVPEGTPTEVVEHRLSKEERTCNICGGIMEEIGKEVRRSLQMESARFWIREDVYYTYTCRSCEVETDEANIRKTPK